MLADFQPSSTQQLVAYSSGRRNDIAMQLIQAIVPLPLMPSPLGSPIQHAQSHGNATCSRFSSEGSAGDASAVGSKGRGSACCYALDLLEECRVPAATRPATRLKMAYVMSFMVSIGCVFDDGGILDWMDVRLYVVLSML